MKYPSVYVYLALKYKNLELKRKFTYKDTKLGCINLNVMLKDTEIEGDRC